MKKNDINNGLKGEYPDNFKEITKNKRLRDDKKLFKIKFTTYAIDNNNRLVKLKEISEDDGNTKILYILL